MDFQGKTVLITGGASGIGFLCGKCFAKEGANIALVDYDKEGLDKAVEEIQQITPHVLGCFTDIREYDQVTKSCEDTVSTFGSIDILICCAGGCASRILNIPGEFIDLPPEVIDFSIDINLRGALYYDHAVMKQMARQNSGVIINMGSITGEEGCPVNIPYAATKSALMNGVVKSLAQCGAKYNVRACCVSPGPVLTRPAMANMKTLMNRAAQPQEIVDLILYLASDKAAFITGSNILIDGGRHVMQNRK